MKPSLGLLGTFPDPRGDCSIRSLWGRMDCCCVDQVIIDCVFAGCSRVIAAKDFEVQSRRIHKAGILMGRFFFGRFDGRGLELEVYMICDLDHNMACSCHRLEVQLQPRV